MSAPPEDTLHRYANMCLVLSSCCLNGYGHKTSLLVLCTLFPRYKKETEWDTKQTNREKGNNSS